MRKGHFISGDDSSAILDQQRFVSHLEFATLFTMVFAMIYFSSMILVI